MLLSIVRRSLAAPPSAPFLFVALVAAIAAIAAIATEGVALADTTPPRPLSEPVVERPDDGIDQAVSVLLELGVDAEGKVEEALVRMVVPADATGGFAMRAVEVARAMAFEPAKRDGVAIRARVSYLMLFQPKPRAALEPILPAPPPPPPPQAPAPPVTTNERDEDYAQTVRVKGEVGAPRGVGDFRVRRELLDASPRLQTSEMLAAAPGFFVDHEDGEGLGNDVYLRGFDLEHGSGIEFHVGGVPINIPTHLLGQGYADLNFVIPEVVRSIHVIEGVYDPHQGDAAIVGSADFDLGVAERGYQVKSTYGSFNQTRLVGIVAPPGVDEETFAAVSLRHSGGFGPHNRPTTSASTNAQYAFDIDGGYRMRVLATAYGARAGLAGVVRRDDVDAGNVGFYDSYASPYANKQSATSSRVVVAADLDHLAASGGNFEASAWTMITAMRLRQNFTGNLESSQLSPSWDGRGDLFETVNDETAVGGGARYRAATLHPFSFLALRLEPGVSLRAGDSDQRRSLLSPVDLSVWDKRIDAGVRTLDVDGYFDVEARLWERVHVAGGVRADALDVMVNDRLINTPPAGTPAKAFPGSRRESFGIAYSPRVSVGVDATPWLTPMAAYGEGFRSLDAQHLFDGSTHPYSKVRSVEGGLRAHSKDERYVATVAFFDTFVGNELVFEAVSGGLETQHSSTRQGFVSSVVARPLPWLVSSLALSFDRALYDAATADGSHYVPGVPPVIFRADVSVRRPIVAVDGHEVQGRVGVGYTYLSPKHLTDAVSAASQSNLNVGVGARYRAVELGVDAYNLLNLRYADDEEAYISNWHNGGGQPFASFARHITAAPPITILGTLTLFF